jgi:hypothetical protein
MELSYEEAIHNSIHYQDLEILDKIFNNFNEEDLTIIGQKVLQEFKDELEILNKKFDNFHEEELQEFKNEFNFLKVVNNESIRRYLVKEKKLDEYMKIYNEKYKSKKSKSRICSNNDETT